MAGQAKGKTADPFGRFRSLAGDMRAALNQAAPGLGYKLGNIELLDEIKEETRWRMANATSGGGRDVSRRCVEGARQHHDRTFESAGQEHGSRWRSQAISLARSFLKAGRWRE